MGASNGAPSTCCLPKPPGFKASGRRFGKSVVGAKIGVMLENKFIPQEIAAYLSGFPLLGGQVEVISRLWYGDYKPAVTTFYGDVDPSDDPVWASPQKIDVRRDIFAGAPRRLRRRHHGGELHERAAALSG